MPCRFSLDLPLYGLGPASKWCHVSLALICHRSLSKALSKATGHSLRPWSLSKGHLWLSANRTALFHWTLDIRPSSKVTLNIGLYFFLFLIFPTTHSFFSSARRSAARRWCFVCSSPSLHYPRRELFFPRSLSLSPL